LTFEMALGNWFAAKTNGELSLSLHMSSKCEMKSCQYHKSCCMRFYVWLPSNETALGTDEAMHYIMHIFYILVIMADILRKILM
jgi:hypothetical protein